MHGGNACRTCALRWSGGIAQRCACRGLGVKRLGNEAVNFDSCLKDFWNELVKAECPEYPRRCLHAHQTVKTLLQMACALCRRECTAMPPKGFAIMAQAGTASADIRKLHNKQQRSYQGQHCSLGAVDGRACLAKKAS